MNRKIFYVDGYCEGEKQGNIGFVKLEDEGFFIMLRGMPFAGEATCRVYAVLPEEKQKYLMEVPLDNGYGQARAPFPKGVSPNDCLELYLPIDNRRFGRCVLQEERSQKIPKSKIQPFRSDKITVKESSAPTITEPLAEAMPVMEQDKWAQLCRNFSEVHIFPEADTIVIKPKDMVVLTQEYHELAANSFVLHAYYNYRQLLLLRYHQGVQEVYYLGVPGVYYEREKRIAMMFGFEGFENGESRLVNEDRRQAYAGCFGYYMKQVNI